MENKNLTHWKKNNDSRYISGEDLHSGLNGLKNEMIVTLDKFNDSKSFDQQKNADSIVTALYFKTLDDKEVYKPAILNKTNAKFFVKESGSEFMENWIGKTVIMYAQSDKRHGFVVRFKSYHKPLLSIGTPEFEKAKTALLNGYTIDKIKAKYQVSEEVETKLTAK